MTEVPICSSLSSELLHCVFWLSANSWFFGFFLCCVFLFKEPVWVQVSEIQLGNWESAKMHHFGLLSYDLEIVTKVLLWISLAIPTLLKTCPFLSLKPQVWFAYLRELSFVYNGKWGRELLVHLCPVLWRCEVFLEAAWYTCPYSPHATESSICSPLPALSQAFKELLLRFCSHRATGCLYCQFWLKTPIQEPDLWRVLHVFGSFPQLLYFSSQWEPCLSISRLSFLFSLFHRVFILINSFPNVHHTLI